MFQPQLHVIKKLSTTLVFFFFQGPRGEKGSRGETVSLTKFVVTKSLTTKF